MDIELISRITLIALYCLFSMIRIEYYRRTRTGGYRTVIEERRSYVIWLSFFICYEVFTFFTYIFFPEILSWGGLLLPSWARLIGALLGVLALVWFIWIHKTLGHSLSARLRIKDSQTLVTKGPYCWVRHPMYTAFYVLHLAVFFLTANWFIGVTWTAGLSVIILLRVKREEAMLLARFGESYNRYMGQTGRFLPRLSGINNRSRKSREVE